MSVPAGLSRDVVRSQFQEAQAQDRHENGHSYSGGLGMASGLLFVERTFENVVAAQSFLEDDCVKWEEARAVKRKLGRRRELPDRPAVVRV